MTALKIIDGIGRSRGDEKRSLLLELCEYPRHQHLPFDQNIL